MTVLNRIDFYLSTTTTTTKEKAIPGIDYNKKIYTALVEGY